MQVIYKYRIGPGIFNVEMPQGAQVLTAAAQHGEGHVWAVVNPDAPKELRRFCTLGTGEPLPDGLHLNYLSTLMFEGGMLVYHVFEAPR